MKPHENNGGLTDWMQFLCSTVPCFLSIVITRKRITERCIKPVLHHGKSYRRVGKNCADVKVS